MSAIRSVFENIIENETDIMWVDSNRVCSVEYVVEKLVAEYESQERRESNLSDVVDICDKLLKRAHLHEDQEAIRLILEKIEA